MSGVHRRVYVGRSYSQYARLGDTGITVLFIIGYRIDEIVCITLTQTLSLRERGLYVGIHTWLYTFAYPCQPIEGEGTVIPLINLSPENEKTLAARSRMGEDGRIVDEDHDLADSGIGQVMTSHTGGANSRSAFCPVHMDCPRRQSGGRFQAN